MKKPGIVAMLLLMVCQLQAQRPKQYKLEVGEQFRVSATIKQDITQTMFGQDMETKQTISTVDLYEVVAVSGTEIKMRTTGLSRMLYTVSAGGSVSIDSDSEGDDHLAFRALTHKSYYVVINKYGRFLRFEEMDKFGAAVKEDLKGTALEGQGDALLASFSDETLGTAVDGQFFIYPEPGKPWNRSASMKVNNLPISIDYAFSWDGNDKIKAKGTMSMSGEIEVMGSYMTANMEGEQESVFSLEKSTGLPVGISTAQEMEGTMELEDLTVPMTLKTDVTVKIYR